MLLASRAIHHGGETSRRRWFDVRREKGGMTAKVNCRQCVAMSLECGGLIPGAADEQLGSEAVVSMPRWDVRKEDREQFGFCMTSRRIWERV